MDAGDVLLFSCSCMDCSSIRGKVLCSVLQEGTNSRWNHVGLIVVDPRTKERLVLEATLKGVALTRLDDRLAKAREENYTVALRRLQYPRSTDMRETIWAESQALASLAIQQSMLRLLDGAVVKTESRQSVEYLQAQQELLSARLPDLNKGLKSGGNTLLQQSSMAVEARRVRRKLERVQKALKRQESEGIGGGGRVSELPVIKDLIALADRAMGGSSDDEEGDSDEESGDGASDGQDQRHSDSGNGENHSTGFKTALHDGQTVVSLNNSELVAHVYQHLDLLPPFPEAMSYAPKDFSEEDLQQVTPRLVLKHRAQFLPEEILVAAPVPEPSRVSKLTHGVLAKLGYAEDEGGAAPAAAAAAAESKTGSGSETSGSSNESATDSWAREVGLFQRWKQQRQDRKDEEKEKQQQLLNHRNHNQQQHENDIVLEALKRNRIASALSPVDRARLARAFRPVHVHDGCAVYTRGDPGDSVFVVGTTAHGARIQRFERGIDVPLREHGPGTSFGTSEAINGSARRSTTICAAASGKGAAAAAKAGGRNATPLTCDLWRCPAGIFEEIVLESLAREQPSMLARMAEERVIRRALHQHPHILATTNDETAMVKRFFPVTFRAGEVVYEAGDASDNMYIVESGVLSAQGRTPASAAVAAAARGTVGGDGGGSSSSSSSSAAAPRAPTTMRKGDLFGDTSMLFGGPRGRTVVAETDVKLWGLSYDGLSASWQAEHSACAALLRDAFAANASVVGTDGERYMTVEDFFRAVKFKGGRGGGVGGAVAAVAGGKDQRRRRKERVQVLDAMMESLVDESGDRLIDFGEFVRFDRLLNKPGQRAVAEIAFRLADKDRSGTIDESEFRQLWRAHAAVEGGSGRAGGQQGGAVGGLSHLTPVGAGTVPPPHLLERFHGGRHVGLEEFVDMVEQEGALPDQLRSRIDGLVTRWRGAVLAEPREALRALDGDDDDLVHLPGAESDDGKHVPVGVTVAIHAASAAASRTAVAPLDRLKIINQALGPRSPHDGGWWGYRGLYTMYRTEGLWGLWRGHSAYLARVVPCVAIQLAAFGQFRAVIERYNSMQPGASLMGLVGSEDAPLTAGGSAPQHLAAVEPANAHLSTWQSLACAGLAGCFAQSCVYPLDVARARLAVSMPPGVKEQLVGAGKQPTTRCAVQHVRAKLPTKHARTLRETGQLPASMQLRPCGWGAGGAPTLTSTLTTMYQENGVRGLFRGYPTMLVGVFTWTALNYAIADAIVPIMPKKVGCSDFGGGCWQLLRDPEAAPCYIFGHLLFADSPFPRAHLSFSLLFSPDRHPERWIWGPHGHVGNDCLGILVALFPAPRLPSRHDQAVSAGF